jgi:hypothetical protein
MALWVLFIKKGSRKTNLFVKNNKQFMKYRVLLAAEDSAGPTTKKGSINI